MGLGAVALGLMLVLAVLARPAYSAAPRQAAAGYVVEAVWPQAAGEPVAVAARSDGGSYTLQLPRRSASDWPALVARAADGTLLWQRPVRDEDGTELRPLAVAAGTGTDVYVATERRLLRLDGDGKLLWAAPAGDGHPDFGAAARGLTLSPAGDLLLGADLVNARLLGYRSDSGALRLRLGTAGAAPGSFLAPVDVAVLPGGDLLVAEHGNRRLQRLDAVGNPVARWPVAGRPRALAVTPAGRVLVLLDDETVRVLDGTGAEIGRFGGLGRAPGQLQLASDLAALPDGRMLVADRGNARVQVFRPLAGGETPAAEPTAGVTRPPPTPMAQRLSACPERPAQLDLAVTVPSAPPRADVLIVVDTTGSMESLLSTIRQRVADIRAALTGTSDDVAVGLMDVRDYPYGKAGLASDWPWLLRAPVSTDPTLLAAAAADLWSGGGGDAPEAYAGALVAALDDPRVGWRPGARRFIVLLGDAVPRDVDLNEGLTSPDLPGVWTPGQPGNWRDSGPDWAPGTADDLRWLSTLDRLKGAEVTLLVGVTGVAPLELAGNPGALVRYWQHWAARSGPGGAAVLASDLTRLTDRLSSLVGDAGRHITRLAGVAGPGDYGRWVTFEPPAYLDLDVPPAGLSRSFTARIAPPPDTPDGSYNLVLDVVGDGARYAAVDLTLSWRAVCEATPTVAPATMTPLPATTLPPSATPTATTVDTAAPTATPTGTASPRPRVPVLLPIAMKGHCLGLSRVTSDIVLVLDTSSSMRAEDKLDAALSAAGAFVDLVDLRRDHVALVAFDSGARLAVGLTGERARLAAGLAGLVTGEGTRLDRGLDVAVDELTGPRARPTARRVVILLTDGRPDAGTEAQVDAALRRAQTLGSLVFTIGLGSDVDAALLRRLAGDSSRYYPAPAKGDLERIYRRIAEVLPCG